MRGAPLFPSSSRRAVSLLCVRGSKMRRLLLAVSWTVAKGNPWRGGHRIWGPQGQSILSWRRVALAAGAAAAAQMAVPGGALRGGSLAGAAQTREPGGRSRRVCSDTRSISLQRKEQRWGCTPSDEGLGAGGGVSQGKDAVK